MPKVPRFSAFKPASNTSSRIKQQNRSRDTKAEVLLRKELWRRGLRYRLHARHLVGKPDIVFNRARVVVFCDGDFWHGRRWKLRKAKLEVGTNPTYWVAKIAANIQRDRRVTRALRKAGWSVYRCWESEVLDDVQRVANAIVELTAREQLK